ncbi:MAG UNVERIFIED_CONTAM: hypothetical protein LVQ98_06165 [Rickettsiaceae bacterium]|jgi:hypothetical protein
MQALEHSQPTQTSEAKPADDEMIAEENLIQAANKFVVLDEIQCFSPSEIYSILYILGLLPSNQIPNTYNELLALGDGRTKFNRPS